METQYGIINTELNINDDTDSVETLTLPECLAGIFVIVSIYLVFVLKILPAFMKNRQPYLLNGLLTCYNAFQVVFAAYVMLIYAKYITQHGFITTRCPKGDDMRQVVKKIQPYFIAKHIDLLDTVFFVLRKKEKQVTFLHVHHHSVMIAWAWFYYMYYPTDHFVVVGLTNSFVHVLMYAYYGFTSLGPRFAKFVWWKKHLTKVQLVQFILTLFTLHYQQKLTPCPIPMPFHYFSLTALWSFLILFLEFYIRSYRSRTTNGQLKEHRRDIYINDEMCKGN